MKKIYICIALLLCAIYSNAQTVPWNLVKNYSFENHRSCTFYNTGGPSDTVISSIIGQSEVVGWGAGNIGNPNYFHRCNHIPIGGPYTYGVPQNYSSYQNPYFVGDGYVGIIITAPLVPYSIDYREYVQTQLQARLKTGKKYCVGTYANIGIGANTPDKRLFSKSATKNIGVYLSPQRPFNPNNAAGITTSDPILLRATPQVEATHYLTDTANWELISGIVTAKGDEEWLTIGNFKPNFQTDTIMIYDNHTINTMCYYFIDNVFVIPMESDEALLHRDTTVCANKFPLQLTANTGFSGYQWSNGTAGSSLQVSGAGTYTVTATYAGCTIVDTVRVRVSAPTGSFLLPSQAYCANKFPARFTLPDSIYSRFTGFAWSNGDTGREITVNSNGIYTVSASSECGLATAKLVVSIAPDLPDFSLGRDSAACNKGNFTPVLLQANYNLPNYVWSTGAVTPSITAVQSGTYTLVSHNDCGEKSSSITLSGCAPVVYIPNAFSPNDDGNNDVFAVYTTDAVVRIRSMQVFDRWGQLVFVGENFAPTLGGSNSSIKQSGWDGTFRGQPAAQDVYVYLIDAEFADGTVQQYKGDVTLLR